MAQQAEPGLSELAAMMRELLLWEDELSGMGLPPALPSAPDLSIEGAQTATQAEAPKAASMATSRSAPLVAKEALQVLAGRAAECTDCRLHEGRNKSVFHRGSAGARIAFVGEGPGYYEDQQGSPFVGKAGQLLDKMIAAMGLSEGDYYICNVVKCRPPENRTPRADEAIACKKWLQEQLDIVKPEFIVALGKCATEHLGCLNPDVRRWRGVWGEWAGIPVMPTYHPAFLLRSPQFKRPAWEDLQAIMSRMAANGDAER